MTVRIEYWYSREPSSVEACSVWLWGELVIMVGLTGQVRFPDSRERCL